MIRRLYDWTLRLAAHRRAEPALGGLAFLESVIFPIPPDVLLLPMVLARPDLAWRRAGICLAGSMLGALAGYALGLWFFEALGRPILEFYDMGAAFAQFQQQYNEWGGWIIALAGVSPLPYKVFTIASGVTGLNLAIFLGVGTLSRGARFFLAAGLLKVFGPAIQDFVEKRLAWVAGAGVLALVGGFAVLRYV